MSLPTRSPSLPFQPPRRSLTSLLVTRPRHSSPSRPGGGDGGASAVRAPSQDSWWVGRRGGRADDGFASRGGLISNEEVCETAKRRRRNISPRSYDWLLLLRKKLIRRRSKNRAANSRTCTLAGLHFHTESIVLRFLSSRYGRAEGLLSALTSFL